MTSRTEAKHERRGNGASCSCGWHWSPGEGTWEDHARGTPVIESRRATAYVVAESGPGRRLLIEKRRSLGDDVWAITDGGQVLNKSGKWEWEMQPSSRTDAFLARSRFTLREAVTLIESLSLWDARWDRLEGWVPRG